MAAPAAAFAAVAKIGASAVLLPCPADVKRRAAALWQNGFGFEPPNDKNDSYVICVLRGTDYDAAFLEKLKDACGSHSLQLGAWLDRPFLQIHWSEFDKVEAMLTELLRQREAFHLQRQYNVSFSPVSDAEFKWCNVEAKMIAQLRESLQLCASLPAMMLSNSVFPEPLFDIWNWRTPHGRAMCNELRGLRHLPVPQNEQANQENYWNWAVFQQEPLDAATRVAKGEGGGSSGADSIHKVSSNDEHVAAAAAAAAGAKGASGSGVSPRQSIDIDEGEGEGAGEKEKEKEEEEADLRDTCMICLDAFADTIVLPCEHQVVCQKCSNQLASTPDSQTCVRCRRPIHTVLQDS